MLEGCRFFAYLLGIRVRLLHHTKGLIGVQAAQVRT